MPMNERELRLRYEVLRHLRKIEHADTADEKISIFCDQMLVVLRRDLLWLYSKQWVRFRDTVEERLRYVLREVTERSLQGGAASWLSGALYRRAVRDVMRVQAEFGFKRYCVAHTSGYETCRGVARAGGGCHCATHARELRACKRRLLAHLPVHANECIVGLIADYVYGEENKS